MDYRERIGTDPQIMLGKPTIKGTRITLELILRKLSEGANEEDILKAYPHLQKANILAALSYSADVVSREEMIVG